MSSGSDKEGQVGVRMRIAVVSSLIFEGYQRRSHCPRLSKWWKEKGLKHRENRTGQSPVPPAGSVLPGSARWCLPWGQYLLSLNMTKLDTTVHKGPNLAQKEFSQPGRHWVLPLPTLCQPLVYPGPGSQLRSEFLAASTVVGILLDRTMPLPSSSRGLQRLGFMEAGIEGSRALSRAHQTGFPPSLLSLSWELKIFLSPFTSVWASLLPLAPSSCLQSFLACFYPW